MPSRSRARARIRARPSQPVRAGAVLALLAATLAGCLSTPTPGDVDPAAGGGLPGAFPAPDAFDRTGAWSRPLVAGPFAGLPVQVVDVPAFDGIDLNVGLYLPDVPDGTPVPVVMDVSPYFGTGEGPVDQVTEDRLSRFLIDHLVPHGYAVALASIRGTGDSGGCSDFMGRKEQADVDSLVTWAGTQPWSNGNVGLIGKSYDGGTVWEGAMTGNPHLKTIVPLAGVSSMKELHFYNGTAEGRAPVLWLLYAAYNFQAQGRSQAHQVEGLCAGLAEQALWASYSSATGDARGPVPVAGITDFWLQRHMVPDALAHFQGSVYFVQGLQDWNVRPDLSIPLFEQVPGDKKLLLGQWAHDYPDRPGDHPHATRYDFAEGLLRWFDKYLKDRDVDTGPVVEVEDSQGVWRVESTWPPADIAWVPWHLGAEGALGAEPAGSGSAVLANSGAMMDRLAQPGLMPQQAYDAVAHVVFTSAPLDAELRLAGMPQVPLEVVPLGPGGHATVGLYDMDGDDGVRRLGHGVIDLRFADGGDEMHPVVPGQPLTLMLQMHPLDVVVPEGHRVALRITQDVYEPLASPLGFPFELRWGPDTASRLLLPTIERGADAFVGAWPFGPAEAEEAAGVTATGWDLPRPDPAARP